MNPLTQARNQQKITQREVDLGLSESASWHARYSHSAYVFIGGLKYEMTEGDILTVFAQYGEVVDVKLVRDRDTGKSKGFGFLAYYDQRSTNLAVDNLNCAKVLGRVIRVDHVDNYKRQKKELTGESSDDSEEEAEAVPPPPPTAGGAMNAANGKPSTADKAHDLGVAAAAAEGFGAGSFAALMAEARASKKLAATSTVEAGGKRKRDDESKEERAARKAGKKERKKEAKKEAKKDGRKEAKRLKAVEGGGGGDRAGIPGRPSVGPLRPPAQGSAPGGEDRRASGAAADPSGSGAREGDEAARPDRRREERRSSPRAGGERGHDGGGRRGDARGDDGGDRRRGRSRSRSREADWRRRRDDRGRDRR